MILCSVVKTKRYPKSYAQHANGCLLKTDFLAGVTIMLSITIFATIVGDMLPVSDATPLIG